MAKHRKLLDPIPPGEILLEEFMLRDIGRDLILAHDQPNLDPADLYGRRVWTRARSTVQS